MKRIREWKHKKILLALAGGALCLALVAGVALGPKESTEDEVLWREYQVERGDITVSLDGSGTLSLTAVPHGFDADIKIEKVFVKVGQTVKKGELLVQYARGDIEKTIAERRQALKVAQRALQDLKNGQRAEALQTSLAQKQEQQAAQKAYETAKGESERAIQAQEQQVAQLKERVEALRQAGSDQLQQAQRELEDAQTQLETQKAALAKQTADYETQKAQSSQNQGTQQQIDALNNKSKQNAIQNAQAEVDQARGALQEAEALLLVPQLTAKKDGIVTAIHYLPGEEVPAGKDIVTIGDEGEKQVTVQVAQEDIGSVETGQQVELRFPANQEAAVEGTVLEKSLLPTEGGDGVTYQVTVSLPGEHPELLEGMTCSAKFILKRVENVLTLANKAITLREGKQYVTVQQPDGSHEEREIQTGFSDGRISEVTGGLSLGETVVVAG